MTRLLYVVAVHTSTTTTAVVHSLLLLELLYLHKFKECLIRNGNGNIKGEYIEIFIVSQYLELNLFEGLGEVFLALCGHTYLQIDRL